METLRIGLITLVIGMPACPSTNEAPEAVSVAPNTLTMIGSMTTPRSGHTATLLASGKVLITGGQGTGGFLASAELFDPATRKFSPTASMAFKRAGHTATVLPNGSVLIVGGLHERDRAEIYDPLRATFIPTAGLITKRVDHTATLLPSGKVLIVGGSTTGTAERPLASAELYDPSTGRFTAVGNMKVTRTAHAAALLNDRKVLITGGGSGRYPMTTVFRTAEFYDPERGAFTHVSDMTTARYKHAALVLADGKVLITGGSNERDWRGRHASAELYNPATATFTAISNMSGPRFKHRDAVVLIRNGQAFIAGGREHPEIYDPRAGAFMVITGSLGEPRFFSAATVLRSGEVLITGGYSQGTPERGPVSTARAWVYKT